MKYFSGLLSVFAVLFFGIAARGEISATNEVLPGISIFSETRTNPPTHLFVAMVDLKNPKLHLRVSRGGADPDGAGEWQTTLLQPTKIAAREKFDFVINGDFFTAKHVKDAEGTNSGYRADQWASVLGPAMTDGETWAVSSNARPALVIHKDRSVTIEKLKEPAADDWQVIAGNVILIKDGAVVTHNDKPRHPRTLAGLNAAGNKLIIMLVDGRKPGVAIGMTYDEEAAEMLRLGCRQALNLDGGGSSVMAVREAGKLKILNEPTDGRERAVGDVFGITVDQD
ncbi:MAG TPA: phosphodiester glycosidase family protein [Verrucomicrobiae bacterium]|nr:phosphodiester glycosidase family protein [Verrucomicrobiae bacterium]